MHGVNIINYAIQVTTDVHRGDGPSGRRAQQKLSAEHIYIIIYHHALKSQTYRPGKCGRVGVVESVEGSGSSRRDNFRYGVGFPQHLALCFASERRQRLQWIYSLYITPGTAGVWSALSGRYMHMVGSFIIIVEDAYDGELHNHYVTFVWPCVGKVRVADFHVDSLGTGRGKAADFQMHRHAVNRSNERLTD